MPFHDPIQCVMDALKACRSIENATAGLDLNIYGETEVVRLATERAFEILGEALNRADKADPSFRSQIPEIGDIIGMRNKIAHGYDNVDDEIIWRAAENHVPGLKMKLEAWLEQNDPPSKESEMNTEPC